MRFDVAATSQAGPRALNEDEAAFWRPAPDTLIAAVADGLGGMGGGDRASAIAMSVAQRTLDGGPIEPMMLLDVAMMIHLEILAVQQVAPSLRRMATTFTAGAFKDHRLVGVHCGDSRAVIARERGIIRLTTDHSEGERLHRIGKLTKEELREYPRKHILDSALGAAEDPQIEAFEFDLQPGDKVFLTTDGFHTKILLRELRDMAARHSTPDSFVDEAATEVGHRSPQDNFTLVAVFVSE